MPVGADFDGHDFHGRGLAYEDYNRCHTETHKSSGERRINPAWVNNDSLLREALVLFYEIRCGWIKRRSKNEIVGVRPGTLSERLRRAQESIKSRVPALRVSIRNLCSEYAALKKTDPRNPRLRRLGNIISGIDTTLLTIERGPGLVLRIVHLFYRVGLDSPGVGEELGLQPGHVRKVLFNVRKAGKIAEELNTGRIRAVTRKPTKPQMRPCIVCGTEFKRRGTINVCGQECRRERCRELKRKSPAGTATQSGYCRGGRANFS